jgi:hypothetical protein
MVPRQYEGGIHGFMTMPTLDIVNDARRQTCDKLAQLLLKSARPTRSFGTQPRIGNRRRAARPFNALLHHRTNMCINGFDAGVLAESCRDTS